MVSFPTYKPGEPLGKEPNFYAGIDEMRAECAVIVACIRRFSRESRRNNIVAESVLTGETYADVGRAFGLTGSRVREIVYKVVRKAAVSEWKYLCLERDKVPIQAARPAQANKLLVLQARHGWPVKPKLTIIREFDA